MNTQEMDDFEKQLIKAGYPNILGLALMQCAGESMDGAKVILDEVLSGNLRIRSLEEVQEMDQAEEEVYTYFRKKQIEEENEKTGAEFGYEQCADGITEDGFCKTVGIPDSVMSEIKSFILARIKPVNLIDKAQFHPALRKSLEWHDTLHNDDVWVRVDGDDVHIEEPRYSQFGVELDKAYFTIPLTEVKKHVGELCAKVGADAFQRAPHDKDNRMFFEIFIENTIGMRMIKVPYSVLCSCGIATLCMVERDSPTFPEILSRLNPKGSREFFSEVNGKKFANVRQKLKLGRQVHNVFSMIPYFARWTAFKELVGVEMLEVFFPYSDLQLIAKAAKCPGVLALIKSYLASEEPTLKEYLQQIFEHAAIIYNHADRLRYSSYIGKEDAVKNFHDYNQDSKKALAECLEAGGISDEEAQSFVHALRMVCLCQVHDHARILREFCEEHPGCITANDRCYVAKDDKSTLKELKDALEKSGFAYSVRGEQTLPYHFYDEPHASPHFENDSYLGIDKGYYWFSDIEQFRGMKYKADYRCYAPYCPPPSREEVMEYAREEFFGEESE